MVGHEICFKDLCGGASLQNKTCESGRFLNGTTHGEPICSVINERKGLNSQGVTFSLTCLRNCDLPRYLS